MRVQRLPRFEHTAEWNVLYHRERGLIESKVLMGVALIPKGRVATLHLTGGNDEDWCPGIG